MTEVNLLTDVELEAWSADEPPTDFAARVLDGLDAVPLVDAVPVLRPVPAIEMAAPSRWPRLATAALAVAAAAGLALWLAAPDVRTQEGDGHQDHAAARVAGDAATAGEVAETRPRRKAPSVVRPPAPVPPPKPESAGVAPEPPRAPAPPPIPRRASVAPPVPPATPAPAPVAPVPRSPHDARVAPPAPPAVPATPAPAPPAPAPPAPVAPPVPAPPAAAVAPPVPSPAATAPTSGLGLHVRADASTEYKLQCKFGDSKVTFVRSGDLDIGMASDASEDALLLDDGELVLSASGTIDCTIRRKKGGRIEAVLQTPRGDSRATLVPPARKLRIRN